MCDKLSKMPECEPDEFGLVIEPEEVPFGCDTTMGIIKIVSDGGFPVQVEDRPAAQAESPSQKTHQVSLLSWEFKRRI